MLARQHAIITGGGKGIGAAIARELARAGARVTLMGRDLPGLEAHARHLRKELKADITCERCDVSLDEDVQRAFAGARARFGEPAILVNNAGQAESLPFAETTRALWDRLIAVNLTSVYLCIQQVLPSMLAARAGRIVNIASTAGLKGYSHVTAYAATKHAVVGLTRSLALEVAKKGVTVNAVCPGYTETVMALRGIENLARRRSITHKEARAMLERTNPRGTLVTPDEVASTVLWLCSPAGRAVNGQAIAVAAAEPV